MERRRLAEGLALPERALVELMELVERGRFHRVVLEAVGGNEFRRGTLGQQRGQMELGRRPDHGGLRGGGNRGGGRSGQETAIAGAAAMVAAIPASRAIAAARRLFRVTFGFLPVRPRRTLVAPGTRRTRRDTNRYERGYIPE